MTSHGVQIFFPDLMCSPSSCDLSTDKMGSISLICPMCCQETFNNVDALKQHLLSVANNLFCPGCSEQTFSLAALIEHLGCCSKTISQDGEKNTQSECVRLDGAESESFLATVDEHGNMIIGEGRTIQMDENGDIRVVDKVNPLNEDDLTNHTEDDTEVGVSSDPISQQEGIISAKQELSIPDDSEMLDDDNEPTYIQYSEMDDMELEDDSNTGGEAQDGSLMFMCSACGMSFSNVQDHIRDHHDSEEVELEIPEQVNDQFNEMETTSSKPQLPSLRLPTTSPRVPNNRTRDTTEEDATQDTIKDKASSRANSKARQRQSLNTLRTEECIDSDGRQFTRKVVQIERFWDKSPVTLSGTKAPMIEKFFSNVEGVKVRDKSITVAPTKMYRCNQCLGQFAKLTDFRIHNCFQVSNRCEKCDMTFSSVRQLHAHMRTHRKENPYPPLKVYLCTECGTEFLTHKSLQLHRRMHQPVKSRPVVAPEGMEDGDTFECTECGKVLSESYREAHMATHDGDSITCIICNRKFDSEQSLQMHRAVHAENSMEPQHSNEFILGDVQESIETMMDGGRLANEAITIEKVDEETALAKPYSCQHCGRRFTRPHEKVKHERIHTGEKPHICEVCGKTFRVSYCLTLHMRTHTGVRPYECKQCGKRFKASSVYNHHLLTHSDARAYTCPYCPKTFKTRVQLAGHKNSHTKPFRCTECSRPFASLYAARSHMQTHKKDNNLKFTCEICGATYGRAFALKDHLKQHDNINSIIPPDVTREEEVQVDFLLQQDDEEVVAEELIVPSPPPAADPIETIELIE